MEKNQKEPQDSVIKKKQWIKPEVEIINTGNIASGSIFLNEEGAWEKHYHGGIVTKATYFS